MNDCAAPVVMSKRRLSLPQQAEEEAEVDKYHGLRVHCWVLVLSGKREVPQNFFIEPSTGGHLLEIAMCITLWVCVCVL